MSSRRLWLWRALAASVLALGLGACDKAPAPSATPASTPEQKGGVPSVAQEPAFTILAGSELKDVEPAILAAARAAGVEVKLAYAGTLDIVERIEGGESFDAILPPNGAYPALVLKTKVLAREKLFYSRIALGVKAKKATALGWDKKVPGWAEIAKAAGGGKLDFAMTNPTSSNTGMSALFAVASALAGKTEDLAVADVDAGILKTFLSGQKLTAGSSGWLAEAYIRNPAAVDAVVNYEAVILRANEKLAEADRLSLIYPRDGVISADYPLMLLNGDKREAYQKLVASLKGTAFQGEALSAAYLRPAIADAKPSPALPNTAVAELTFPNRLEVIDAVLGSYQAQWRRPATSIFVLDVSGSMRGERMNAMRESLKLLSGAQASTASARYASFQDRERVALITFSDKVAAPVWVHFESGKLEEAREELRRRADALVADGGTAIYSALASAQDLARQEQERDPGRFVSIVLLTDGESNAGLSPEQFRARYPDGTPARIFPIVFGEASHARMQELAQLSGGREFDGRKARLALVFRDIRGYQ